jgi:hypothetical protein
MSQPYDPVARPRSPEAAPYETQRETEAALAARMELGPEYSEHIAAGLAERVEQLAAIRTAELRHQSERTTFEEKLEKDAQNKRFVLGIISLGVGVPITAIAGSTVEPGLVGVAVAWAGIVGVNVANALAGRRRQ